MRKILFIIPLFFLILSACASQKEIVEVPVEIIKREFIHNKETDSIYIRDSIDRYVLGDTVYMYKYKYIYRYLNRVDTIIKTDTIDRPIKITLTRTVEVNKLKWYQKILMWLGGILIIISSFRLGRIFMIKK